MKKVSIAIITIACVLLICGAFYLLTQNQSGNQEKELTEIEKVLVKDLEKDYPKTPREVVKYYNRIVSCYYDRETSVDQLGKLVDQMMYLMDEDLLLINPRDEYFNTVVADVEMYKQQKKYIVNTTVCDSNDVVYFKDPKGNPDKPDEMACVAVTYFVKKDGKFSNTHQEFILRKDDEGRWKMLVFYAVEGDTSEEDE